MEKVVTTRNTEKVVIPVTNIVYRNEFDFCRKVVRLIMCTAPKEKKLENRMVDVLGAMCKMCSEGREYMNVENVHQELEECGVKMKLQTLYNYITPIKNKGWIVDGGLHKKILTAINDRGMQVGIMLKT